MLFLPLTKPQSKELRWEEFLEASTVTLLHDLQDTRTLTRWRYRTWGKGIEVRGESEWEVDGT